MIRSLFLTFEMWLAFWDDIETLDMENRKDNQFARFERKKGNCVSFFKTSGILDHTRPLTVVPVVAAHVFL